MPQIDPKSTSLLNFFRKHGKKHRGLPISEQFAELADKYHQLNPDARNLDLAVLLNTRPQSLSQWKTGSDPSRRPPWHAVLLLLYLCDCHIVIKPSGISVVTNEGDGEEKAL